MMQSENQKWTMSEHYGEIMEKRKEIEEKNKDIAYNNKFKPADKQERLIALPHAWLPYPDLKKNDMFGDPFNYWVNTTIAGAQLEYEQNCDKCKLQSLPEFKTATTWDVQLSHIRDNETVSEAIQKQFQLREEKNSCPVASCAKEEKDSTQTISPFKATSENHWLINVDISSIPEACHQDFYKELYECKIPKALILNDTVYKLGQAQFNRRDTHFVSWHYDSKTNNMVYYDSITPKDKESTRFWLASMSDLKDLVPSSMQYFRTNLTADKINDILALQTSMFYVNFVYICTTHSTCSHWILKINRCHIEKLN